MTPAVAGSTSCRAGSVRYSLDEAVHRAVQGRGEQHPLPAGRNHVEDLDHRRQEPEIGHVVRLVEHGDLHPAEVGGAPFHQVDQASRSGDHDVDATLEGAQLWRVGHAAGDQHERQPGGPGERSQHVADLVRQLAGRGEDDCPRAAARGAGEGGDERQTERQGLARARPGPAEHVPARQRVGDRGRLDGERCRDPGLAELLDQDRRQPQRPEVAGDHAKPAARSNHSVGRGGRAGAVSRGRSAAVAARLEQCGTGHRGAAGHGHDRRDLPADHRFLGVPSALEDLGCMLYYSLLARRLTGLVQARQRPTGSGGMRRRTSLRPQSC